MLLATHLMAASKKGMSAKQMERMLGVTYKTAWFLCHRIREAMGRCCSQGSARRCSIRSLKPMKPSCGKKRNRLSGKVAPKQKVVSLVERDGVARSFHVANIHHNNIRSILGTNVDRASHLMTDDARVYWSIGKEFASHGTTLHSARSFVKDGKHSNTARTSFSILQARRGRTYHHWSHAHLGRYLAEFDLRYNTRDMTDGERAAVILKGAEGRRLTYRRTDKPPPKLAKLPRLIGEPRKRWTQQ
jgi:hypothetical protein